MRFAQGCWGCPRPRPRFGLGAKGCPRPRPRRFRPCCAARSVSFACSLRPRLRVAGALRFAPLLPPRAAAGVRVRLLSAALRCSLRRKRLRPAFSPQPCAPPTPSNPRPSPSLRSRSLRWGLARSARSLDWIVARFAHARSLDWIRCSLYLRSTSVVTPSNDAPAAARASRFARARAPARWLKNP